MFAYSGGKHKQARWIRSFIPATKTYAEIFGGAMWVYVANDSPTNGSIVCDKAIYNDFNKYMYNLFTSCRDYDKLHGLAKQMVQWDQETFDRCESTFRASDRGFDVPDFELAVCYAYISTHVFSGMLKPNGNKMAKDDTSKYKAFVGRLLDPTIRRKFDKLETLNLSYEQAIEKIDGPDVVMYVDPPYYGTEKYYILHSFGLKDHERLADILKECRSKWLLSYYDFPDLVKWFPEDRYVYKRKEYAKMTSHQATKNKGVEVLVMNYEPGQEENPFI